MIFLAISWEIWEGKFWGTTVTLIEDSITDEELRSEPSQKLLVINKRPLGVFETPRYLSTS